VVALRLAFRESPVDIGELREESMDLWISRRSGRFSFEPSSGNAINRCAVMARRAFWSAWKAGPQILPIDPSG
jgi:hypothetical protein